MTFEPNEPVHQIISQRVDTNQQITNTIDAADVADVVMDDLERLSKLKGAFENLFMDQPRTKHAVKVSAMEPASAVPVPVVKTESSAKSKKERIIEMARALNSTVTTDDSTVSKKKTSRQRR